MASKFINTTGAMGRYAEASILAIHESTVIDKFYYFLYLGLALINLLLIKHLL